MWGQIIETCKRLYLLSRLPKRTTFNSFSGNNEVKTWIKKKKKKTTPRNPPLRLGGPSWINAREKVCGRVLRILVLSQSSFWSLSESSRSVSLFLLSWSPPFCLSSGSEKMWYFIFITQYLLPIVMEDGVPCLFLRDTDPLTFFFSVHFWGIGVPSVVFIRTRFLFY